MHQESLEELMAQFRQLENGHSFSPESIMDHSPSKANTLSTTTLLPSFSWKHRSSWRPYLILLGGLFVFVVILLAVFRPSFLYSSEQAFLWKRFFLTILITYLLLLGTLYGLYYYAILGG